MRILLPLLFFIAVSMPTSVLAQKLDSEHKAWSVFSLKQSGEKICYITSSPSSKKGNYKKRSEPYLLVTYRGNGVAEVSVFAGYPYKNKSKVAVTIDKKKKFSLFTASETPKIAWAKDAAQDKKLIRAMKKGSTFLAKAKSKIGSYSQDTYSLSGFTKAYSRMQKLCN